MAKSARRPAAKVAPASGGGAMRPALLAAGLGLCWFVESQGADSASDMPIWGYGVTIAVRLLADFVGALVVVSAVQLALILGRLGLIYLRGLWLQGRAG